MTLKSKGFRRCTRYKLSKKSKKKGLIPITRSLATFDLGQKVHIALEPSVHKGMPHPRFHGKTGTVVERRGRSYMLEIREGDARKLIISRPEHLKAQTQ
ncbi:MAG: 50S ribosomal protein L21e [Candidatus Methanofastidiosa archaeon]|nr:50S ribosomal protein L21e [Candidatus Methanofastidiosa archaeon]